MLKKIEDMNHYELLEVSPRATAQEIHKAYERIRKIYDPNSIALYSLFTPEETEKIRQRIEDAYRTLIYEENRREYDLSLADFAGLPADMAPVRQPAAPAHLPVKGRDERRPEPPLPQSGPSLPPVPPARSAPAAPIAPSAASSPRPAPAAPEPPTALPIQPPPADIVEFTGPFLKMMREQRGLTARNISEITKLSARYVEGIEEENYQKLPSRPYLRGFLVLYCKAIGYEPDRIVSDYMKRYDLVKNPPKK
jgi:curved DNA-binding protein CbpA